MDITIKALVFYRNDYLYKSNNALMNRNRKSFAQEYYIKKNFK